MNASDRTYVDYNGYIGVMMLLALDGSVELYKATKQYLSGISHDCNQQHVVHWSSPVVSSCFVLPGMLSQTY